MRYSQKDEKMQNVVNQVVGVELRDPMQSEGDNIEASLEFGLTGRDINKMRKSINRN